MFKTECNKTAEKLEKDFSFVIPIKSCDWVHCNRSVLFYVQVPYIFGKLGKQSMSHNR